MLAFMSSTVRKDEADRGGPPPAALVHPPFPPSLVYTSIKTRRRFEVFEYIWWLTEMNRKLWCSWGALPMYIKRGNVTGATRLPKPPHGPARVSPC